MAVALCTGLRAQCAEGAVTLTKRDWGIVRKKERTRTVGFLCHSGPVRAAGVGIRFPFSVARKKHISFAKRREFAACLPEGKAIRNRLRPAGAGKQPTGLARDLSRMAFPVAPHQRPPCVKGAVTLTKRDWGIVTVAGSFE